MHPADLSNVNRTAGGDKPDSKLKWERKVEHAVSLYSQGADCGEASLAMGGAVGSHHPEDKVPGRRSGEDVLQSQVIAATCYFVNHI